MYTRYYDGYTDRNCPVKTVPKEEVQPPCEETELKVSEEACESSQHVTSALPFSLPFNLQSDDLILLAVLFLIASESNDDFILPLILGYLLISNT